MRGEPQARVIHEITVRDGELGGTRRLACVVRCGNAIRFVSEHGQLLLSRVTEVAALLGYINEARAAP